jgi:hypothetical protein
VSASRLFALDQNFPEPVVAALSTSFSDVELVPVRLIRRELSEVDDWQLLLALHQDERPWDGLITNDEAMLSLPKEMTVLAQTHLTLVVAKGEGHNPIRAIGVLLCHLQHVCHHTRPDRAQIWNLRVSQKNYEEPSAYLDKIASKRGTTANALFTQNRLAKKVLRD